MQPIIKKYKLGRNKKDKLKFVIDFEVLPMSFGNSQYDRLIKAHELFKDGILTKGCYQIIN